MRTALLAHPHRCMPWDASLTAWDGDDGGDDPRVFLLAVRVYHEHVGEACSRQCSSLALAEPSREAPHDGREHKLRFPVR